jgi:hypothetical protein
MNKNEFPKRGRTYNQRHYGKIEKKESMIMGIVNVLLLIAAGILWLVYFFGMSPA